MASFLGETRKQAMTLLDASALEIIGHADVQRAARFAGQDLDEVLLHLICAC